MRVDGREVCEELVPRVPAGVGLSGSRDRVLLEGLGDRVGRLVFPGRVGEQLLGLIAGLGVSRSLTVTVSADAALGVVAVEAARLADGTVPA